MTEKKEMVNTTKVVYNWQKIPMIHKKDDKFITKTQVMVYNIVQSGVWDSVTTLLAKAHGYTVSELIKLSGSKNEHAIYIEGTFEQCEKHLQDLKKGVLKGESTSSIISQIKNNRLLKKHFRKKNVKIDVSKDKLDELIDKLLMVGIILKVYIQDDKENK